MPADSAAAAKAVTPIFDPARLRVARLLRQMTQARLGAEVNVSPEAISQFERRDATPKPATLGSIARALDFPVEFFGHGPGGEDPDPPEPFFRSLRSTPAGQRHSAKAGSHLLWLFVRHLENLVELPPFDLPSYQSRPETPTDQIEAHAKRTRSDLGLDPGPVPNVVRQMESRGVVVFRSALTSEKLDAFGVYYDRPVVVLGADKAKRDRSRFDAAHELGHLVLHSEAPQGPRTERAAHEFAAAFLMPADDIRDLLPSTLDWQRLARLKSQWQVSFAALLRRCLTLERIDELAYRRGMKFMSARGWRRHEPVDLGPPEAPELLQKAKVAVESRGATLEDVVDIAHLPRDWVMGVINETLRAGKPQVSF